MLTRRKLFALLALSTALPLSVSAQQLRRRGPFSSVIAGAFGGYRNYLFKLTYMGPQTVIMRTTVFGSATLRSAAPFAPYRRPGYRYANDDKATTIDFAMTPKEVQAVIKALSGDKVFTDPRDREGPILSFMIMRDAGGPREAVFETLVEFPHANRLVGDLIARILDNGNALGVKYVRYWSKNVGG